MRLVPYTELHSLDETGNLCKIRSRADVHDISIESVPTLCKGQMFWVKRREKGIVRYVRKTRYGGLYYYIVSNGREFYYSSGIYNAIIYNGYLYSTEGNEIVVKLDKSLFEGKRRSCRMCISDCNNKVCPFYDSILNYI